MVATLVPAAEQSENGQRWGLRGWRCPCVGLQEVDSVNPNSKYSRLFFLATLYLVSLPHILALLSFSE